MVFSVLDPDPAVLDANVAVSERLPRKILLPRVVTSASGVSAGTNGC